MRRLILAALFALISAGASAQTEPQFVPFLDNGLTGGSGPGAGMLTTGANATSAAFGNLVTAATAASARTSLGLGTGDSPTFTGLTLSSMTQGSVLFAGTGGLVSQDNSNFFWDDTNNRLGIGTIAPIAGISVQGSGQSLLTFDTAGSLGAVISVSNGASPAGGTGGGVLFSAFSNAYRFAVIKGYLTNGADNSQGDILFFTRTTSTDSTLTAVGAIKSTGNWGILNTTAPANLSIGTTAATSWTLNTFTDASNYANAFAGDWGFTADVATYGTNRVGSGTARGVQIVTATAGGTALPAITIGITQLVALPQITSDATHVTSTVCQDTTSHALYAGSGAVGICLGTSSLRFKTDVEPLNAGLADLAKVQTISYRYKSGYGDPSRILYGFSAEQMMDAVPGLVGLDAQGRPNSVDWAGMVPVIVKATQELDRRLNVLEHAR